MITLWIDAQLPPAIAGWINSHFADTCHAMSVRDLGLRDAKDIEIFHAARKSTAVVLTKDADFMHLQQVHGAPPRIIWITCGNTSNAELREILIRTLPGALELLAQGDTFVQISTPDNKFRLIQ